MNENCCYGPYEYSSLNLTDQSGPTFVDTAKSRLIAVITKCDNPVVTPTPDAVLLHESIQCPDNECDIRWYECPGEMRRTYTIVATPCNVLITSFENGLLKDGCDASVYGMKSFCYGKIYTSTGIFNANNSCTCIFEFDGITFTVNGVSSECSEIFNCPDCPSQELSEQVITQFGELPQAPPLAEESEETETNIIQTGILEGEGRTKWHNTPSEAVGQDTVCFPAKNVIGWPVGGGKHVECASNDNPSIAVLPSGHAAIAYEDRDAEGKTKISIALFNTSVKGNDVGTKIFYYRLLSRGTILNDSNLVVNGGGTFEVFEELSIPTEEGVPDVPIQLGFLTGPFRGKIYDVKMVNRGIQSSKLPKHVFSFSSEGDSPDFPDSNNAYNVAWFLIFKDDTTLPAVDIVTDILDLPVHQFSGKQVPVSHPSIAVPNNHHMVGGTQYLYLTYQAFEDERWKVYFQQISLNDNPSEEPSYAEPYEFKGNEGLLVTIDNIIPPTITYKVSQRYTDGIILCAQFDVFLPDGRQVFNCDQDLGFEFITCNAILRSDTKFAHIGATAALSAPGCSDGVCADCMPPWNVGDEFIGAWPPSDDNVKVTLAGVNGDPTCVTLVDFFPGTNEWCAFEATCQQTYLTDDPYCPSPYLSVTYHPEDLWTINVEGDVVTRVLYHMGVSRTLLTGLGGQGNQIDFMFCIDWSRSMADEIIAIRANVSILAQSLQNKGFDARFGLTIFARANDAPNQPDVFIDCSRHSERIFDGLQNLVTGGFTSSIDVLVEALDFWGYPTGGPAAVYVAMQFAVASSDIQWRSGAARFMLFITDTSDVEIGSQEECPFPEDRTAALNAIIANSTVLIIAVCIPPACTTGIDGSVFLGMPEDTGWTGEPFFNVRSPYNIIFDEISRSIVTNAVASRVIERDIDGTIPTFLRNAQVMITYEGDLSDLWTFEKKELRFDDNVPISGSITKGLTSLPRDLAFGRVYGIDPVHLVGDSKKWVFFPDPGPIVLKPPKVGRPGRGVSNPILISDYASRAKINVNNRNDVIIVYEDYLNSTPQISMRGTGDFHQNSITGPKGGRITKFFTIDDFAFDHSVTLEGEGLNQLCDFIVDKNDVTHITWQSNRDNYWEIYYGNSYNLFSPIRVTKSESRSGFPSIDVDDDGSIFVVYHDNRFGPFEIMLASKDEERVTPLLQQDAYLASLRSGYQHYVNVLPIFITNTPKLTQASGTFVGTKIESGQGNNGENQIFTIDSNGVVKLLSATDPFQIIAIASSRKGTLYGITLLGDELLRLAVGTEDPYIVIDIVKIADLDFGIPPSANPSADTTTVLDMTVDGSGRIWLLLADQPADADAELRIVQINPTNGKVLVDQALRIGIDEIKGGITTLIDGTFVLASYRDSQSFLETSPYPTISSGSAVFSWTVISKTFQFNVFALTSTEDDAVRSLVRIDGGFDEIHSVNVTTGDTSLLSTIGSDSSSAADDADPVETIAGYAYLFSNQSVLVGTAKYFHVRMDFYDNINLEGEPIIRIDSRDNLESFINDFTLEDPYLDPYAPQGMEARGIFLTPGTTGIVFFDATNFRPGMSLLSQPYGFETNRAYFPKIFAIPETQQIAEAVLPQTSSFSCSKCTRFGDNNFDTSGCSFSFRFTNSGATTEFFNFQIDFYADSDLTSLVRRFNVSPNNSDLQFIEVDNDTGDDRWGNLGLPLGPGQIVFIQVYPALDLQAGFVCGIKYYVQVNQCSAEESECATFTKVTPTNWISTSVSPQSNLYGSIHTVLGDPAIAWQSARDLQLLYSTFTDNKWVTKVARDRVDSGILPSLAQIGDNPAIAYVVKLRTGQHEVRYTLFDGNKWNDLEVDGLFDLVDGVALLDNGLDSPMVFYIVSNELFVATQAAQNKEFSSVKITSTVRDPDATLEQGIAAALINGIPSVVFINVIGNVMIAQNINGAWPILTGHETGKAVGTPDIDDIEGQIGLAFVEKSGALFKLVYKQWDGDTWTQFDTFTNVTTLGANVGLSNANSKPAIVYCVIQTANSVDVRYTRFDGSIFRDEIVESDVGVSTTLPKLDITNWNRESIMLLTNTPFHVYYFNQGISPITGIKPTFLCRCSSHIFSTRLTHVDEIARWQSSAFGYSDTRVSDTTADSMRPVVNTRSTGAAIILWDELDPYLDSHAIRGATFRSDTQDQLRSSGTQHWFDYDFDITGQNAGLAIDMFDRAATTFEVSDPVSTDGFHGRGKSPNELPSNSVFFKNCDFDEGEIIEASEPCDIEKLTSNVITSDPFLVSSVIKKIKIKDQFVDYYTYNAAAKLTPVVSVCDVILEIIGTPEVVAFRVKNENDADYPNWCPWSPKIGDYHTEQEWTLSPGQGIKEVCIQAITYSGITAEFCMSVIGDYPPVIFEVRFFDDADYTVRLPSFDGMAVASTGSDPDSRQRLIYVEILASIPLSAKSIQFDVFQQGVNDKLEQKATRVEGTNLYRGNFTVETEDKVRNMDGLARIRPRFPNACEDTDSSASNSAFQKDEFNVVTKDAKVFETKKDILALYRQDVSGRIGVDITLRRTEDPYFVFGDPNYILKREDGRQFPGGTDTSFAKSNLDFAEGVVDSGTSEEDTGEIGGGDPIGDPIG